MLVAKNVLDTAPQTGVIENLSGITINGTFYKQEVLKKKYRMSRIKTHSAKIKKMPARLLNCMLHKIVMIIQIVKLMDQIYYKKESIFS